MYRQSELPRDRYSREAFESKQIGSIYELTTSKRLRVIQADIPKGWADMPAQAGAAKKREAGTRESIQAGQGSAKPQHDKPVKTKVDYEAEYHAKLAAHQAAVADFERRKREREEQIARQNAAHVAAQEAAREKATFEEKLAAHRRELDEANRRQQAYFEAQRRHA